MLLVLQKQPPPPPPQQQQQQRQQHHHQHKNPLPLPHTANRYNLLPIMPKKNIKACASNTVCQLSPCHYTTNFESHRSSRHLFFRKTRVGPILFARLTSHPLQPVDAAASAPAAAAVSAPVSDMDALLEMVKLAFACAKWTFVLRAALRPIDFCLHRHCANRCRSVYVTVTLRGPKE